MKDLTVDTLIIEDDRPVHIAKHNITIDEVLEVLISDYTYISGRDNRWLLIGKTVKKRFITIILGERSQRNTYGLVTVRPARREEQSFYLEYTTQQGGGEDDTYETR